MSLKKLNKGDTVILKAFTGMKVGVFTIEKATDKTITIVTRRGKKLIFDRATGTQINTEEGKERYAGTIMENDGSFVRPSRKKKSKKDEAPKKAAKKKSKKKVEEPEEIDDDDDDFEDDEE